MNQRGLLFATPYLLLLLAIGVVTLESRVWRVGTGLVLALICVASLKSYQGMMVDPADYARFANAVKSEIRSGRSGLHPQSLVRDADTVLPSIKIATTWWDGIIARPAPRIPAARIWVVMLYDSDPAKDMQAALAGYRTSSTLTGDHAKAILYEPSGGSISQTFKN